MCDLDEPKDDCFHGHHRGVPGNVSAWNPKELQACQQQP